MNSLKKKFLALALGAGTLLGATQFVKAQEPAQPGIESRIEQVQLTPEQKTYPVEFFKTFSATPKQDYQEWEAKTSDWEKAFKYTADISVADCDTYALAEKYNFDSTKTTTLRVLTNDFDTGYLEGLTASGHSFGTKQIQIADLEPVVNKSMLEQLATENESSRTEAAYACAPDDGTYTVTDFKVAQIDDVNGYLSLTAPAASFRAIVRDVVPGITNLCTDKYWKTFSDVAMGSQQAWVDNWALDGQAIRYKDLKVN